MYRLCKTDFCQEFQNPQTIKILQNKASQQLFQLSFCVSGALKFLINTLYDYPVFKHKEVTQKC